MTALMIGCGSAAAASVPGSADPPADAAPDEVAGIPAVPLVGAASREAINTLIKANANVNHASDANGETALMQASRDGHAECVSRLLQAEADVNQMSTNGETALMQASRNGHTECVLRLSEASGEHVDIPRNDGRTALMLASQFGKVECVRQLVDAGAGLDNLDIWGCTALMFASYFGKNACVSELLDRGADVNASDFDGETALMKASQHGRLQCCRTLIERGAAKDAQCAYGFTALMLASVNGHNECVLALIHSPGADVEIATPMGWTALMLAAFHNRPECVIALIKGKASVNTENNAGRTALLLAAMKGNCKCVTILIKAGAVDVPTASELAAAEGHPACVEAINFALADGQYSPVSRGAAGELQQDNLRGGSCFSEGRARTSARPGTERAVGAYMTLIANLIGRPGVVALARRPANGA